MNDNRYAYLSPKVEIRLKGGSTGIGAYALERIAPGELISVWSGFIVDGERLAELPEALQRHSVQVEENLYLASWTEDEPADFINHSCDPNTGLSGQLVLISMRTIEAGEEITFDYATSDGSVYDEFLCECGSERCRGRVSGEDWRRPELWERYRGFFSPYLQRRIDRLQTAETVQVVGVGLNGHAAG